MDNYNTELFCNTTPQACEKGGGNGGRNDQMNQIIQSPNNLICRADAPHVGGSGLRIVAGVAMRQVDAPRVGGTAGFSRG